MFQHLEKVSQPQIIVNRKCNPKLFYFQRKMVVVFGLGTLAVILIPVIHFGVVYTIWDSFKHKVNKSTCTCTCWDTKFKGFYEVNSLTYKHIYFNITSNTFKIWTLTVLSIIGFYESLRKMFTLIMKRKARTSMVVLFLMNIYPNYYTWWNYFNYWNDDFYHQWYHQLLFSSTELLSLFITVHLLDMDVPVTVRKLLILMNIASFHIMAAIFDQFFINILIGDGYLHQIMRDIGFAVADLAYIIIPYKELKKIGEKKKTRVSHLINNQLCAGSLFFLLISFGITRIL